MTGRAGLALLLLLTAGCGGERGSMFEVSRVKPRDKQAARKLCPGEAERTVSCSALQQSDFPRRVPQPRVLQRVVPKVPAAARERRLSGMVVLQVGIRRDGTVGGICVLKPLPCGLTDAAADAVRQWRFEPQEEDVVTSVSVEVRAGSAG